MVKAQAIPTRPKKQIRSKPADKLDVQGKTLNEVIASGWTLPSFEGAPRSDGLAWSEVEAPSDPS